MSYICTRISGTYIRMCNLIVPEPNGIAPFVRSYWIQKLFRPLCDAVGRCCLRLSVVGSASIVHANATNYSHHTKNAYDYSGAHKQ